LARAGGSHSPIGQHSGGEIVRDEQIFIISTRPGWPGPFYAVAKLSEWLPPARAKALQHRTSLRTGGTWRQARAFMKGGSGVRSFHSLVGADFSQSRDLLRAALPAAPDRQAPDRPVFAVRSHSAAAGFRSSAECNHRQ